MNSLTLFVLLFATIQVQCSPAVPVYSKDSHAPEGHKNSQREVGVNKEESQLLFGDNKPVMKEDKDVDYMEEKKRVKKYNKNYTPAKELNDVTKDEESDASVDNSGEYSSGEDIIEGDIKLTPEEAAIFKRGGWKELVNSESWYRDHGKWSKTIPYTINNRDYPLAAEEREALKYSIDLFHKFTCLKFVPKANYHRDYIEFADRNGCWSYVGKLPGNSKLARPQIISLGRGCREAVPAHEIMHALGRYHEHVRFDRDRYVRINFTNINENFTNNFEIKVTDNQNIPYDFLSVMHYGSTFFSINGQPTIEALAGPDIVMGQRNTISLYDILNINIRYCPERAVQLVGGRGSFEGRVEMFWDGRWAHLHGSPFAFKTTNGRVVCKYLGFPDVSEIVQIQNKHSVGPFFEQPFICNGNEYSPFSCQYLDEKIYFSGGSDEAAVICEKNARLLGGKVTPKIAYGRLEVYVEGRWGTVCEDYFDIKAANVVCRQMGYTQAVDYNTTTEYGRSRLPILMDDVMCNGREAQITHCVTNPIGEHNCNHNKDISLTCILLF